MSDDNVLSHNGKGGGGGGRQKAQHGIVTRDI